MAERILRIGQQISTPPFLVSGYGLHPTTCVYPGADPGFLKRGGGGSISGADKDFLKGGGGEDIHKHTHPWTLSA